MNIKTKIIELLNFMRGVRKSLSVNKTLKLVFYQLPDNAHVHYIYLTNDTNEDFIKVTMSASDFMSIEDDVIKTEKTENDFGPLKKHSSVFLEEDNIMGLEMTTTYDLKLYKADGETIPFVVSFKNSREGDVKITGEGKIGQLIGEVNID